MQERFSKLKIPFNEQNHASVFFAHLQNLFSELEQSKNADASSIQLTQTKIDKVMCDIYRQHQKLEGQFIQMSANCKGVLQDFTAFVDSCKDDKQMLAKVTQDRHDIMERLKQSVDQSLTYVQQNEQLHRQISTMQELNTLLYQKCQNLQQQIKNKEGDQQHVMKFSKIKEQYDRIANSNNQVQNQFSQVNKKLSSFCEIAPSLQVLGLAFDSKPNLKEIIWNQVQSVHEDKLVDVKRTKKQFYDTNFLKILSKM